MQAIDRLFDHKHIHNAVLQLYMCISFVNIYLPMIANTFYNIHDSTPIMPMKYAEEVYGKDKD